MLLNKCGEIHSRRIGDVKGPICWNYDGSQLLFVQAERSEQAPRCTAFCWKICPSTSSRCTGRSAGRKSGSWPPWTSQASACTRSTRRTSYRDSQRKLFRQVLNSSNSSKIHFEKRLSFLWLQPTTAQRYRLKTEKIILEDLLSSALSEFKEYRPSGNLKFNN